MQFHEISIHTTALVVTNITIRIRDPQEISIHTTALVVTFEGDLYYDLTLKISIHTTALVVTIKLSQFKVYKIFQFTLPHW